MFCSKCGKELKETDKFCNNCGTVIDNTQTNQNKEEKQIISGTDNATVFCIISLILMHGLPLITWFIPYLKYISGIGPLAGLVLLIYTRIKYPESKFAKILLIVEIVLFALGILAVVIMIIACGSMLSSCSSSSLGMILPFI